MVPESFKEAITCDELKEWKAAMNREMNSLVENNTWTLVSKPSEEKKGNRCQVDIQKEEWKWIQG